MKFIILTALALLTTNAQSSVQLKFLPLNKNAIAIVMGSSDLDFADLYAAMNVPEQDTSIGKGKGIKTTDKSFTLVCSRDRSICQIVLNLSPDVDISPARGYMSYRVNGAPAIVLAQQFKLDQDGELFYMTSDRHLRLHATAQSLIFEASKSEF